MFAKCVYITLDVYSEHYVCVYIYILICVLGGGIYLPGLECGFLREEQFLSFHHGLRDQTQTPRLDS